MPLETVFSLLWHLKYENMIVISFDLYITLRYNIGMIFWSFWIDSGTIIRCTMLLWRSKLTKRKDFTSQQCLWLYNYHSLKQWLQQNLIENPSKSVWSGIVVIKSIQNDQKIIPILYGKVIYNSKDDTIIFSYFTCQIRLKIVSKGIYTEITQKSEWKICQK